MQTSLVVVNHHGSSALARLLEAIEGVDEVVVVDHSEDEDETANLQKLPVHRVVVQSNSGYGAGLNRGVREASGDVVVLANPDVIPAPGAIQALIEAAARPEVGVAAASLSWDEQGRWLIPQAQHLSWWTELEARYLPRLAWRRYLRDQLRLWTAQAPVATSVVSGTFVAVSREVFAAAGGFDERYFLFFEENDFCMRVRRLDLSAVVVPEARVFHQVGVSVDAEVAEHMSQSLMRYRQLWCPMWYTTLYPDPIEPAPNPLRRTGSPPCSEDARWVIGAMPRFIPMILGPPVGDADPAADDFWPPGIPRQWKLGVLDGNRVKLV